MDTFGQWYCFGRRGSGYNYFRGNIWFGLVSLLSLIGLIELYKTMGLEKTLLGYVGYGMTVIYSVMLHQSVSEAAAMAIVVMLFADQCGLCIYISEV